MGDSHEIMADLHINRFSSYNGHTSWMHLSVIINSFTKPTPAKKTLKDLTSELYTTVASEWEFIGIQLQLDPGELDTLKTKEPKAALIEVLKMWLRTVDPPPTWKAIIDAVRLFNPSLATSLTTKYCT